MTTPDGGRIPNHIAVIMDGNGRWARQRGLPRLAGHRAGTENIRAIVNEAHQIGVRFLTLYAFSTENWNRPSLEVQGLMQILSDFIDRETQNLHRQNVRLRHLGRLQGLTPLLARKVQQAVDLTGENTGLTLAIAFNYGGRLDIVDAVRDLVAQGVGADQITEEAISARLSTAGMPDPDLVIRTSGERRISNFLIWQAAYSEYWVTPVFWPDFRPEHLHQAVSEYGRRERRFGGLSE
ncbi:isoprenyl transferase [Candidatus Chloroploca asiatica]|uniref:Isoprenyl transferase n=1 Tax=Candidatus Chloroploca asiatica TaxID=1506545 RepID=A0A2H3KYR8_9CHLR|nr:isoprenyl transferase [Candidatus Chloroploca asiatica]PDW00742.1 di-trans,poly-cis-decaprenylcistransferase [Candidatus Chloroploca asiatica]